MPDKIEMKQQARDNMGRLLTTRIYTFLRDTIFRYRRIFVALLHLLQAAAANYFAAVQYRHLKIAGHTNAERIRKILHLINA